MREGNLPFANEMAEQNYFVRRSSATEKPAQGAAARARIGRSPGFTAPHDQSIPRWPRALCAFAACAQPSGPARKGHPQ